MPEALVKLDSPKDERFAEKYRHLAAWLHRYFSDAAAELLNADRAKVLFELLDGEPIEVCEPEIVRKLESFMLRYTGHFGSVHPALSHAERTALLAYFTSVRKMETRMQTVDGIRERGWSVAVHNDYRQNGVPMTFWLFTKGDQAVKGEGRTDREALEQVLREIERIEGA